jgi:hypothetical protein
MAITGGRRQYNSAIVIRRMHAAVNEAVGMPKGSRGEWSGGTAPVLCVEIAVSSHDRKPAVKRLLSRLLSALQLVAAHSFTYREFGAV